MNFFNLLRFFILLLFIQACLPGKSGTIKSENKVLKKWSDAFLLEHQTLENIQSINNNLRPFDKLFLWWKASKNIQELFRQTLENEIKTIDPLYLEETLFNFAQYRNINIHITNISPENFETSKVIVNDIENFYKEINDSIFDITGKEIKIIAPKIILEQSFTPLFFYNSQGCHKKDLLNNLNFQSQFQFCSENYEKMQSYKKDYNCNNSQSDTKIALNLCLGKAPINKANIKVLDSNSRTLTNLKQVDFYQLTNEDGVNINLYSPISIETCNSLDSQIINSGINERIAYVNKNSDDISSESVRNFYSICEKISDESTKDNEGLIKNPTLKVNFSVYNNSEHQQTDKWYDKNFIDAVLAHASKLTKNKINFELFDSRIELNNDRFSMNQQSLLKEHWPSFLGTDYVQINHINVIISKANTPQTAGLAYVNNTMFSYFIQRSRYNNMNKDKGNGFSLMAIDNDAKIFLHELGHNLNLGHSCGNSENKEKTIKYSTGEFNSCEIHADNYFSKPIGTQLLLDKIQILSGNYKAPTNRAHNPNDKFKLAH